MIDALSAAIDEPDVVFTDVALSILGAYLARRLWAASGDVWLTKSGVVMLGGLASAALWGALFHAFFPANTTTLPGFIAWIPVSLSIVVVATAMLALSLRLLVPRLALSVGRAVVIVYAASFAAVVLLVDESFRSIVRFYSPALVLLLFAAILSAVRQRGTGWTLLSAGLSLSIVAAVLQQAKVGIDPDYFDYNAVYHTVQAIAIVLIYVGFRRAALTPEPSRPP